MKKTKIGLILFFCVYAVLTVVAVVLLLGQREPLKQKLTAYEAAQLDNRSAQVFEELFRNPDWQQLCVLSNTADTPYEGAQAYASFMEAKVKNTALTYRQAYTDISADRRYHVYLGDEKIAAFTMTGGEGTSAWTLAGVELYFERSVSVAVEKQPEQTVYINGVALDDSFTVRTTVTRAEAYLPDGVHGCRSQLQVMDGLLVQPQVTVIDEKGQTVPLNWDPEREIYTTLSSETWEPTETEVTIARNAAIADAKYSMKTLTAAELRQYIDPQSNIYEQITNNPMFIQAHKKSYIDETAVEVSEFCRYSDQMFSAKVKLAMNVIRKDDTLKVYPVEKTYFFTCNDSGDYLVTDYTNEPVQERIEQVRLTFVMGDERQSVMVDTEADMVQLPEVPASAGQKLAGWAVKSFDGETVTMTVRLLPAGEILGSLEPMELYPVYQEITE